MDGAYHVEIMIESDGENWCVGVAGLAEEGDDLREFAEGLPEEVDQVVSDLAPPSLQRIAGAIGSLYRIPPHEDIDVDV